MPDLTPEYLYDEVVAEYGDFVGGGITWREAVYQYQYDLYFQIPFIKELGPSDIAALDPTIHIDPQAGLKKKLFKLTDDLDFYVSLYTTHQMGGYPYGSYEVDTVSVAGCVKHGTDYYYEQSGTTPSGFSLICLHTAGGWSTTGSGADINNGACPIGIVKQYGIKFVLITDYAYGKGVAKAGETKASYLEVKAFIPCQGSANTAGFQSFAHIKQGIWFTSLKEGTYQDWISNRQFIYYGYIDNMTTGLGDVFLCDNITTFENRLKQIAPFDGSLAKKGKKGDPNQETEPSGTGGGGGNMDPDSDPIPFPDLPVGGALSSGAVKAFDVTPNAVTQMFTKLWDSSIFDITTFQKLVESPLDSLVQFQCVPIAPHTQGTGHIMLGNFDTEAVADKIDQEYYTIDCGTLKVEEFWGSALDYNPYTECTLWVPMVGFREVDVNDIMGKTIHLKYNYSIFDGNLTAQLMCGNAVLYKWPGNVLETIPVTQRVNQKMKAIASGVADIVGGAVKGGGAGAVTAGISAAINVAFAQTNVSRSGSMEGSVGLLDDFMPFLIIKRPIQSLAAGFKTQKGYPSNISAVLSSCSGYTEVEYIHLTGITGATDTELEDIERLLKEGVII